MNVYYICLIKYFEYLYLSLGLYTTIYCYCSYLVLLIALTEFLIFRRFCSLLFTRFLSYVSITVIW